MKDATSGYTGGTTKSPTYSSVCSGGTGHAEAVQVLFDPNVLSYKELIRQYVSEFKPQRRSAESNSQYRAAIFYETESEKQSAKAVLTSLGFDERAAESLLEKSKTFYPAEVYHQDYYNKAGLGFLK